MKELNGIVYEKAIEARAKINVLPNLHILVGKSKVDSYYKGLCLDTGIICISDSSKLDDNTLNLYIRSIMHDGPKTILCNF